MHERVVNGYPGGLIMIESQYVIMCARIEGGGGLDGHCLQVGS